MKLLAQEELENLEIPSMVTPSFPVKQVVYISEADGSYIGRNITSPPQPLESTSFNMFTESLGIKQFTKENKVIRLEILIINLFYFLVYKSLILR